VALPLQNNNAFEYEAFLGEQVASPTTFSTQRNGLRAVIRKLVESAMFDRDGDKTFLDSDSLATAGGDSKFSRCPG
jgi:hypothetical protein